MRTSLYSILCIVVRLGAMLLFVRTVASFPDAWAALQTMEQGSSAGDSGTRGMLIGFSGALIVFSIALWLYPGLVARLVSTTSSRELFESSIDARDLQYIALSVLGVAFAMNALFDLVGVVFRIALSAHFGDTAFRALVWQNGSAFVVLGLKFALGVGLAFGARGLVGLLRRLRERGLPPAVSDTDER